jgi:hypothetical protein
MLLPRRRHAYIPEPKLTRYLLAPSHPVGGPKARFFIAHGFNEDRPASLGNGLLRIARQNEVRGTEETPHGTKYIVEGLLNTPRGTTVNVRTVWIADERGRPRFVTAYPS